ncbi:hypothetical protein ACO0RG_000641 [Hanseniaspora osmophila]|uniref:Protein PAL1 n=1 Tax=Hanseniaspora osmophila TaxID=56408 RepID=A0A1E5R166_9ASCO|nr:Protein PAL1 [Hanseniaspora osmophila]
MGEYKNKHEQAGNYSINNHYSGTVRSTNSVGSNGMNRNNPFLTEDQEGYNLTDSRVSPLKNQVPQPYEQRQQQQSQQYPSAREEKERMRQRYLGEENAQPQPPHRSRAADAAVADLPPSYAEVAQSYNKSKLPKPTDSKHASSSRNRSGSNGDMLNQRPSQHRSSGHSHSHHHHHHNREESGTKHRSSSSSKKKSKTTKPVIAKNVDTIDKLDVTGLFGGAFHHDGPFDACTPHRNKNTKVAPVLAFPKDGPNTSLAGTVPADRSYNKKMNQVFGTQNVDEDADADEEIYYSSNTPMTRRGKNGEILKNGGNSGTAKISSLQQRPSYNQKYSIPSYTGSSSSMSPPSTSIMASPSTDTIAAVKNNSSVHNFDTKQRDKVHGPLSQGLGSTTFLDGAPAAASAIKDDMAHRKNVQLNRKKSISQRLGITSPHPENKNSIVDSSTSGTLQKTRSDGPMRYLNDHDHDDDDDDEVYHSGTGTRFNSANDEYLSGAKKESSGNKFLRRVKTLKVGRKN